jgi:hypothetical protein
MNARIGVARLQNHGIERARGSSPEAIVAWLGAVQAQDLRAALWAVGVRLRNDSTAAVVRQALDDGRILRTHILRPTWHFVTAADIYWMLDLTAAHVLRRTATYCRSLGLDRPTLLRGTAVIERALASGEHLTRGELGAALARAELPLTGIRLAVLTLHAELEGVVCSGKPRGAGTTYALLAERARRQAVRSRDDAVGELSLRFLRSHGPATLRDFVWWSGLSTFDARRGFDAIGARSTRVGDHVYWHVEDGDRPKRSSAVHLLPVYDEYLVAYRDLHAVPRPSSKGGVVPQAVVANGQIAGTWRVVRQRDRAAIHITHATARGHPRRRALEDAVSRYARFFAVPHDLRVGP